MERRVPGGEGGEGRADGSADGADITISPESSDESIASDRTGVVACESIRVGGVTTPPPETVGPAPDCSVIERDRLFGRNARESDEVVTAGEDGFEAEPLALPLALPLLPAIETVRCGLSSLSGSISCVGLEL